MSKSYGLTNYICSFGFSQRWRRQCIDDLPAIKKDAFGYDMMSGMGEAWKFILKKINKNGKLIAIDISDKMNEKAHKHKKEWNLQNVEIQKKDILQNNIASNSADFIISTFGIKTFNQVQKKQFAKEIARILKVNGSFSVVEISKPKGWFFNVFYMFYLQIIIPFIARAFLGNPSDYKMLGQYCANFGDCSEFAQYLKEEGLTINYKKYFYGCATGVYGSKIKKVLGTF